MKRRPITGQFDVAVIPCGGAKHTDCGRLPAGKLYKGTPFKKNLEHAQLFAKRVVIMSAKHGLLQLTDQILPYEAYLPKLAPADDFELRRLLGIQALAWWLSPQYQVVSYLPKAYQQMLEDAAPRLVTSRPYAGLNMLQMVKRLNQEIQDAQRTAGR